jgi:OMF family outer membrane factor
MLVSVHKLYLFLLFWISGLAVANAQILTLKQCIDTAQVNNNNLKIGRNIISIGDERYKEAKAGLIPRISANADYKYFADLPYQLLPLSVFGGPDGQFKEAQFGVPHNMNASVQLTMPLYNTQVYGAIQTSKVASELTHLQLQKTEEQVFFEIANLYYNAIILHHQEAFIDSNLLNSKRLLNNMKLLHEQLLVKSTDLSKSELQLKQLNTQKESVNSKYQQILNALKFAMGISIQRNIQIDPVIQFQYPEEYQTFSSIDVRVSEIQNRLLKVELNTLKKSKLPMLSLFGTYGSTGFGYDKQPNSFLKFYPVGFTGLQLSFPLFNGAVSQQKVNQKRFELKNNELQNSLLTEQNAMQVENAKLQLNLAQRSIKTISDQLNLAQTIYEQTLVQQKYQTASLNDVLLSDNALREAQQTYLSSVVDFLKAELELKKSTGNILSFKK